MRLNLELYDSQKPRLGTEFLKTENGARETDGEKLALQAP